MTKEALMFSFFRAPINSWPGKLTSLTHADLDDLIIELSVILDTGRFGEINAKAYNEVSAIAGDAMFEAVCSKRLRHLAELGSILKPLVLARLQELPTKN